jgi:hypothetical protein
LAKKTKMEVLVKEEGQPDRLFEQTVEVTEEPSVVEEHPAVSATVPVVIPTQLVGVSNLLVYTKAVQVALGGHSKGQRVVVDGVTWISLVAGNLSYPGDSATWAHFN